MQQTLSLNYDAPSQEEQICGTCWYYHNRVLDGVRVVNCNIYGYRKEVIENPNCKPNYCKAWDSDKERTKKLLGGL